DVTAGFCRVERFFPTADLTGGRIISGHAIEQYVSANDGDDENGAQDEKKNVAALKRSVRGLHTPAPLVQPRRLFRKYAVAYRHVPALWSVFVKIGLNVTDVLAYSVFANSTSVDFGTNWSVLEAIVVTTPFSVRRIELPLIE